MTCPNPPPGRCLLAARLRLHRVVCRYSPGVAPGTAGSCHVQGRWARRPGPLRPVAGPRGSGPCGAVPGSPLGSAPRHRRLCRLSAAGSPRGLPSTGRLLVASGRGTRRPGRRIPGRHQVRPVAGRSRRPGDAGPTRFPCRPAPGPGSAGRCGAGDPRFPPRPVPVRRARDWLRPAGRNRPTKPDPAR